MGSCTSAPVKDEDKKSNATAPEAKTDAPVSAETAAEPVKTAPVETAPAADAPVAAEEKPAESAPEAQAAPVAEAAVEAEAAPAKVEEEAKKPEPIPSPVGNAPSIVTKQDEEIVFTEARTHKGWVNEELSVEELKEIYDLFKWGPNAFNAFPIRITFVKSAEAKAKLIPTLMGINVEQVQAAPVTAIIAYDLDFKEHFNVTSPHYDAKALFDAMPAMVEPTAYRNSTLLGAYFMLAARMKGYDVGPMSGFDNEAVDKAFFEGTNWKSNFICNLGHGDASKLYPRAPRLDVDDACKFL